VRVFKKKSLTVYCDIYNKEVTNLQTIDPRTGSVPLEESDRHGAPEPIQAGRLGVGKKRTARVLSLRCPTSPYIVTAVLTLAFFFREASTLYKARKANRYRREGEGSGGQPKQRPKGIHLHA